ncbi:MAG TPA: MFS transporter [Gaiellaceae bacterium]|nr:MFS transporter [Gaiellaceae bacterium]
MQGAIESLRAFGAVFANPSLRRLQLAGIGSTLGMWAYGVALAVFVYDAGGARAVGILYAVRWGAAGVAAPWLSVFADRGSRRRVMIAADLSRCAILGGIAALAFAHGPAFPVYALAVLSTTISSVFAPAQGALLPSLVRTPEELTAANAVMNSVSSVGMFAGPALAGALLAVGSPGVVFALTAATFLWSALCLARIPPDRPAAAAEGTHHGALVAGLRTVAASPPIRLVVGLTTAQTFVGGAFEVLLVVLALRLLHGGNGTLGWLNAAMGVGCLVGVVAVAALAGRKRLAADLGLGVLLWGLPIALTAVWGNLGFAVLMLALVGVGNTLVDVAGMTLLQRSAGEEVLGRVFGVLESLVLAGMAAGALVAPGLVSLLGARGALVAVGAVLPALLVLSWPALRRTDAAARVPAEPLELLRRVAIFAPLPPPVLERLASAVVEVRVPPLGEAVVQGAVGDRFYVVRSGRAAVEVDGAETGELGPGDVFGEIALLRDVPRTATVRALDELSLYALERDDFLAAVTGHAPSRAAADSIVAARLPAGAAL